MAEPEVGEATLLLRRISAGDASARERLIDLVYGELRRIAQHHLRGRDQHSLQPTMLVHEAWLRLAGAGSQDFEGRRHFLGVASRAMRCMLVDHARARGVRRRQEHDGDDDPLDLAVAHLEADQTSLIDVDTALAELEQDDPDLARLVELRFFCGLGHAEIAAVLGCSVSTVERDWRVARARLHRRLGGEP